MDYGLLIYALAFFTLGSIITGAMWLFTNYKTMTPEQVNTKITVFILQYAEYIATTVIAVAVKGESPEVLAREVSDRVYDLLEGPDSPRIMTKLVQMFTKDEFYNTFEQIFISQIKEKLIK